MRCNYLFFLFNELSKPDLDVVYYCQSFWVSHGTYHLKKKTNLACSTKHQNVWRVIPTQSPPVSITSLISLLLSECFKFRIIQMLPTCLLCCIELRPASTGLDGCCWYLASKQIPCPVTSNVVQQLSWQWRSHSLTVALCIDIAMSPCMTERSLCKEGFEISLLGCVAESGWRGCLCETHEGKLNLSVTLANSLLMYYWMSHGGSGRKNEKTKNIHG